MIPLIKICSEDNCNIVITDLTQNTDEYVDEDIQNVEIYYKQNRFKYSETYTINIIQRNKLNSSEILNTYYTEHCSYLDEQHVKIDQDGYYTIYHVILPSIDWLNNELSKDKNITSNSDINIYVTDGSKIYKYNNSKLTEVEPKIVSEINIENTTISRIESDQFIICKLFQCYINLCKSIFNNTNLKCLNKSNTSELTYNRDFLWMSINVMKYYIEKGYFAEAERVLENIDYCNGFCQQDITITKKSGCGCQN